MGGSPLRLKLRYDVAALAVACAGVGCTARVVRVSNPPTYESVKTFLEQGNADSVDALLAALPESYLEHYTLMFESRSTQGARFQQPRAIVFGQDASLILAFNGSPSELGYSSLETMEFDRETMRFVLREIAFTEEGGARRIVFSEENPSTCAVCHGSPAHPIWDSYPRWPDAYGETEGVPPWAASRERDGYAAFVQVRATHPRYRELVDRSWTQADKDALGYQGKAQRSPNAELGILLARSNAEAVIHEVLSSPHYSMRWSARSSIPVALRTSPRTRRPRRAGPDMKRF